MSNYFLYWDGYSYQLVSGEGKIMINKDHKETTIKLMLALPTQPQPEDQVQPRPVAAEGVQFVLAPLPQVQAEGMQFVSAQQPQAQSQTQLQAVDVEGVQIVSLPISQPQPQQQHLHKNLHQYSHQNPYQPPHQQPLRTVHQPQHPHRTVHQPPHQTVHRPPQQTDHQPPHQTANQPPYLTAHQPLYQTACQPTHQTTHQPPHQTARQPTHQTTHQPPHQTARQPTHQTTHKPPHQTARQPTHQTTHKPPLQTPNQPTHQRGHQAPHQTALQHIQPSLPRNTHMKAPANTHTTPLTDTHNKLPSDTHINPLTDIHTKSSTDTHTSPPTDTHTRPLTYAHTKVSLKTLTKPPTSTHMKSPTNTHAKLPTNKHLKPHPHQQSHQPPRPYPFPYQGSHPQQRPHQDRQQQPQLQPRPVSGGKKFTTVVQPEFQLDSTTSVLPREGEEVLTNLRRQALANENFTVRKKELQRNQTMKKAILCELRQAQLFQWRRNQNIRRGMEGFRRLQHQRHQRFQKGQQPLTQRHQQVIAEVLPLQTFWRKCYVNETQLQENSHQNHVTAVSNVVNVTMAELSDKFPSAHLPDSCALTSAMLKLITESGRNPRALVSFLQKLGIVKNSMVCLKHPKPGVMSLQSTVTQTNMNFLWKCGRRTQGKKCGYSRSLFKGTFFEDCRVPVFYKFLVILGLLQRKTHNDIGNEVAVCQSTIESWKKQCRKYFIWYGKQLRQIGGPGTVVEILKRTYIDCRRAQSRIVLVGTERITGRTFVTLIPDRSVKTLCSVIVKLVAPGGTVITVRRGEYGPLFGLGYKHKVGCLKSNLANSQDQDTYMDTIRGKLLCLKRFFKNHIANVRIKDLLGEFIFYNDCISDEVDPSIKFLALLRAEMED